MGLRQGKHPFLACSFWLVEQYAWTGRCAEAKALMDRLIGYGNDLGLLSEEYDTRGNRMAGNYPGIFACDPDQGADALHEATLRGDKKAV